MKRNQSFSKRCLETMLSCILLTMIATVVSAQNIASASPDQQVGNNSSETAGVKVKKAALQDFMKEFKKTYDNVYYSYQSNTLKSVKVQYNELDVKQQTNPDVVLQEVLTPAGLMFEKVNKVYVIRQVETKKVEKDYMLPTSFSGTNPVAVDFTVSGLVSDVNGPLVGVSVTEKGKPNATTTDNAGRYSLNVTNGNAVLVFSSIGFTSREMPVNGQSVVSITLVAASKELENVVVTALGITRNKRTLGYSVGEVKSEDIVKASNVNLLKSLDGKVSGVNFTNVSSDPTSSVLVNIRGTTALPTLGDRNVALKGQPLYVVDGVPVGTQTVTTKDNVDFGNILSQLNPEDIDNITILKGGSAGALYGKEGGNGVIMITTKSGKGGRKGLGVTYTLSDVWDKPFQFFPVQTQYGPGPRASEWALDGTDTWGPKLDGTTTSDYWNVKTQQWESKAMYSNGLNPVEDYLQTGRTVTNNISVQGNYDKGSFRLSLSNMDNKGVMPNTRVDQKTISLNTEYRLTNKVKLSVSASYLHTYAPNKARIQGGGDDAVLNQLLYAWPTSLQPLSDMHNYWLTGFEGIRQNGAIMNDNRPDPPDQAGVGLGNPYWWAYENVHRFTRDNLFGKLQLDWQLNKNFSVLLRTGIESVKEYYEQRMSWSDPDNQGKFVQGNNNTSLVNSDAIITYNNNFGKFSLGASVGANYGFSNNNSMEMTAGRLSAPELFTLNNAAPGTLANSNPYAPWGTGQSYSVYGTATLGYDNQVFLDVTGRNDWNGVLPEEKISYFYPSVSLSWIASETFKLPEVVNLLKFRIAKADVGNGLLRRRSIDTYSFDASDWGAAKTVSINASLVDKDIKPQHSVTTEGGFDLGMFSNRARLGFTYFVKEQKDQIDNIPTVQGTGYSGILTNIGDVRNKGVEIELGITPIKTKDFSWDLSASLTKYKAVITRLSDKFAPNGYVFADYGRNEKVRIAVGEEIGNMYEANPVLRLKTGKYAGVPLLDGSGGEFQTSGDERDRARLGNFNPDFILGINTTFRYKQFSLNLVGSLRSGGKYVSVNQKYMESDGMTQTTISSGANNPWWSGGRDASQGGHPWPAQGASQYEAINNNNDGQALYNLQDASYAKGVFLNPNFTGDPATATDADYIVNGSDPNNTFYQIPTNSYGDVIWNFTSTRTYDATNFKMREISLAYTLPNPLVNKYKIQNVTISLIARNVFQWNKSGRNEDPESAFQGVGTDQGVLRATLPSIRSYGFKLSVGF